MNHPLVVARLHGTTCSFTVWAPLKKKVELHLARAKERHAMTKDDFGYWTVQVQGVGPDDPYLFRLDDDKQLPDPASRSQPEGVHGPSRRVDHGVKGVAIHRGRSVGHAARAGARRPHGIGAPP